jgi:hypothetical protein
MKPAARLFSLWPRPKTKESDIQRAGVGRTLSGEETEGHTDPRSETFHESEASLELDDKNSSRDDDDDEPADNGSQRGQRTSLGRPKLMAAKSMPSPGRCSRVDMYSTAARRRSSSRGSDSSSVEPGKREGCRRSVAIGGVVITPTKGKESARERNAFRGSFNREGDDTSVSTRPSTTRSVSRTRDGTPSEGSGKTESSSSRRGRRSVTPVELHDMQDDLNGSSGSLKSEGSDKTESSTPSTPSTPCNNRSSRRHRPESKSPVTQKEPVKNQPASRTRRSRSNKPREIRERSVSSTRSSESIEAKVNTPDEVRERRVSRTRSSESIEAKVNKPREVRERSVSSTRSSESIEVEANKPCEIRERRVSRTRSSGSNEAKANMHREIRERSVDWTRSGESIEVKAKTTQSTDYQKAKLRSSLSAPVGGLARPLRSQDEVMKDNRRRSAICARSEGTGKREGRKSDIFASLDREKEAVEISAGPLMRQLPSRSKSSSTDRVGRPHPLILRQGPVRSENTGPVFGASSGDTTLRR